MSTVSGHTPKKCTTVYTFAKNMNKICIYYLQTTYLLRNIWKHEMRNHSHKKKYNIENTEQNESDMI